MTQLNCSTVISINGYDVTGFRLDDEADLLIGVARKQGTDVDWQAAKWDLMTCAPINTTAAKHIGQLDLGLPDLRKFTGKDRVLQLSGNLYFAGLTEIAGKETPLCIEGSLVVGSGRYVTTWDLDGKMRTTELTAKKGLDLLLRKQVVKSSEIKYRLRDGTPVTIYDADLPGLYPVLAYCMNGDNKDGRVWRVTQYGESPHMETYDVFRAEPYEEFADDEPVMALAAGGGFYFAAHFAGARDGVPWVYTQQRSKWSSNGDSSPVQHVTKMVERA